MYTIRCCHHFHLASTQSPRYELLCYVVLSVHFAPLFERNRGLPVIRRRSANGSETSGTTDHLVWYCLLQCQTSTRLLFHCRAHNRKRPHGRTQNSFFGGPGRGRGVADTEAIYNLCLILKTATCISRQNLRATSSWVTGRTRINGKRKNIYKFVTFSYILIFQCTGHQSISVADLD